MESRALFARDKINVCCALSMLMLVLNGCDDNAFAVAALPEERRAVATVYKIKSDTAMNRVNCYRINAQGRSPMTVLTKNQLVKIVAIEDGLRRFDGQLWLNIYPPLSHRPNCYVNINNLIPYA